MPLLLFVGCAARAAATAATPSASLATAVAPALASDGRGHLALQTSADSVAVLNTTTGGRRTYGAPEGCGRAELRALSATHLLFQCGNETQTADLRLVSLDGGSTRDVPGLETVRAELMRCDTCDVSFDQLGRFWLRASFSDGRPTLYVNWRTGQNRSVTVHPALVDVNSSGLVARPCPAIARFVRRAQTIDAVRRVSGLAARLRPGGRVESINCSGARRVLGMPGARFVSEAGPLIAFTDEDRASLTAVVTEDSRRVRTLPDGVTDMVATPAHVYVLTSDSAAARYRLNRLPYDRRAIK